jgi:hypothetical protein
VPTTNSYNKFIPSLIGSFGAKIRLGSVYLVGEFRAQYTLLNPVNPSKRSITGTSTGAVFPGTSVFDYGYTMPNYKPLNLMINVAITYPYFNPIKLKRK